MDKSLEDAIRHISAELKDHPDTNIMKLVEEAAQRFNLDPVKTEFLVNKYVMKK